MATVDPSLVAHLPLFAGFGADELDEILREARSVRFAKNSAVFEQGEDAHSFFVLLHGHVARQQDHADRRAGRGALCRRPARPSGSRMAIGLPRYPATATAVDDSVVLAWPSARLAAPGGEIPGARHQHAADRRQPAAGNPYPRGRDVDRSRSSSASRTRCCGWPSNPAARSNTASRSIFRSAARTSPQMTGTTLHTVSRILSGWEQRGLIESGRQRIVLREPAQTVRAGREPSPAKAIRRLEPVACSDDGAAAHPEMHHDRHRAHGRRRPRCGNRQSDSQRSPSGNRETRGSSPARCASRRRRRSSNPIVHATSPF